MNINEDELLGIKIRAGLFYFRIFLYFGFFLEFLVLEIEFE